MKRAKELLVQAVETLLAVRDDTAQLDAEVLMMFLQGYGRAQLYSRLDEPVDDETARRFLELVARRAQGEPIAYITSHREFMALDFYVDRRVLIPRPETELLLEYTAQKMRDKGWTGEEIALVDVGTGSGVIAVYLALRFPHARVYATDISPEALDVARMNARRFEVEDRINFLQGNLMDPLPEPIKILVSNPPYTILAQVEPNVARYEPNVALDGGPKGLAIYRELLGQARSRLSRPGMIALEIGSEQATDVSNLGRFFFPGCQIDVYKDYAGLDRVVILDIAEETTNLA
ncbi:MAG: Release factor glutamine methyltransferase [Chloroflexi bacterium]|jgi:release factor glutamine methyltransferase|nr:Release factor glutamine methyltransferase [Chloroflexota bacterium]